MKILKSTLSAISILLIILVLIISVWAVWERHRDPISAIDFNAGQIDTIQDSICTADFTEERRTYRHIILSTENIGRIEVYLSQPDTIPKNGLPVIIILGGLEIGLDNFKLIPNSGNNIIIIYRYPYSPRYWYDGAAVTQIPIIRHAVLRVPSQVLSLCRWVSQQNWAEKEKLCILGYSFGALFVPAVYHLAGYKNVKLKQGVIAYAGVDLFLLLKTNMHKISQPFRSAAAWTAATAIYPIEPALHLPEMNNEFLIINSTNDHQIPEDSWRKLHLLADKADSIIILNEGHMHPRKPELTMKLARISKNWLADKGAINP